MSHDLNKAVRADVMRVNSDDHDKWALHAFAFEYEMLPTHLREYHKERPSDGDLGRGYYDDYIPVTYDIDGGSVLKKTVEYDTLDCPDCETDARKDEQGLPVCPDCGLIVTEPGRPDYEVVNDPKAAGRVDDNGNFIQ